ncbi:hypothetical protein P43SY_011697 [Pythium insidiosum]|uniref:Uncharacterized protein n=1 Tax=Pythium insidiosum TaxID=114742 RepID=A0AAD5LRK9_PYTIN|nr:hypothetical protein P43SY_011697 [Pythium insidiosum]
MKLLPAAAGITTTTTSALLLMLATPLASAAAYNGKVLFYKDGYFAGSVRDFAVTDNFVCVNVDKCFNDKVSSLKWEGIPAMGPSGRNRVYVFEHVDCEGLSLSFWATNASVPRLGPLGINDIVSSFMVGDVRPSIDGCAV